MNSYEHRPIQFSKFSTYRTELYGISAIWILLFHTLNWKIFLSEAIPGLALRRFILFGYTGVDVFLILSGISLYFSMQKSRTMSHYFSRRFLRLMPSLLILFIGIWTYQLFEYGNIPQYFIRLSGLSLWFEGNKLGTWYVSAMLVFYILYPYVYSWLFEDNNDGRFTFSRWCYLLILSLVIFWAMHKLNTGYFKLVEIALGRIPSFLIGCLFGKWVYEKKMINGVWRWPIALTAVFYFIFRNPEAQWHWWMRCLCPIQGILALVAFTYFLSAVDKHQKKHEINGGRLIRTFLRKSGDLSLELYLGSTAILDVLREMDISLLSFTPGDSVWVRAAISVAFIAVSFLVALVARACNDVLENSIQHVHMSQ